MAFNHIDGKLENILILKLRGIACMFIDFQPRNGSILDFVHPAVIS
jgi:hypothetical protein